MSLGCCVVPMNPKIKNILKSGCVLTEICAFVAFCDVMHILLQIILDLLARVAKIVRTLHYICSLEFPSDSVVLINP